MKRAIKKILTWIGRILLMFVAVLVLLISGFYIFRDGITRKAVEYVNRQQPGELSLGKMRLRPFMNFPDVSLQLNQLQYSEGIVDTAVNDSLPVMRFNEIYISLDVMKLLRGQYRVSEVRFDDGVLNYVVSADSVSNLERALGIRFGAAPEDTVSADSSVISLDMKSLEIRNLLINYFDATVNSAASVYLYDLESSFSYFTDSINAALEMEVDVNRARSGNISLDRPRNVKFASSLQYDLVAGEVNLQKSTLSMRDTDLELLGKVRLEEGVFLDLDFRARNQGIELMNFLMSGVLDLDAIEQIGEGEINLNGGIRGPIAGQLPEVKLTFSASDIGFYVKAIDQSVTGITFSGFATNGTKKDLSEAWMELDHFQASFPDGELTAVARFSEPKRPRILFRADGKADLGLLDEIIKTEHLQGLSGSLVLKSDIDGRINPEEGIFLDQSGELTVQLTDTKFSYDDQMIEDLNGTLFVRGWDAGLRDMSLIFNENRLQLDGQFNNLLPYLYGFKVSAGAAIQFEAAELSLSQLLTDTSITGSFAEPIRDVSFRLAILASYDQLNRMAKESVIPEFNLTMSEMEMKLPGFTPLSDLKFMLQVNDDNILLSNFKGKLGQSRFELSSRLDNYSAYLDKDTLQTIGISMGIRSPVMRARDMLTINDRFTLLPESYIDEQLEELVFNGRMTTTVGALLDTSGIPDFRFVTDDMHWSFRLYPLEFSDFHIDMERKDALFDIRRFEGTIGESNFAVNASLSNLMDTLRPVSGSIGITSGLLDFNQLLNYELLVADGKDSLRRADTIVNTPPRLDQIRYPELALEVHIDELRYGGNILYGLEGNLRSMPYKVLYLDRFRVQSKTGGTVLLDGQFNVSNPDVYLLSANFDIDTLNLNDFDIPFVMEDTVYSLSDNFTGLLDANGMAEVFVNPDLSVDLENTTAMLNFALRDGSVRNFTPLQAVGRFTGSKDLDNVRFGQLRNSNLTLVNKKINIPLMSIESTLGLLLIEGEQSLDGDYLYLVRIPTQLTRQTAWNFLSNPQNRDKKDEDEIMKMRHQRFHVLTAYSLGEDSGVRAGDEREKLRE